MIWELYKLMMKEEVRIHTTLFPKIFFYLFPFMIFAFSLTFSILVTDMTFLISLFYIIVFFAGMSSGFYGFQARELYLRKFPHLNFLLYSYFAMPISNGLIMFALFLKDVTFNFFWFLVPFTLGLFRINLPVFINSIGLFLFANALAFLLSNLYNKRSQFYVMLIASAVILLATFGEIASNFWASMTLFVITFILAMRTIDLEYFSKTVFHRNMFDGLMRFFKSPLMAKDFIDLRRSYGFIRIFVSVIFPIIVINLMLALFQRIGFSMGIFVDPNVFYSLMLGLVSVASYDALVEFDRWDFYAILPLRKSELIKSKLKSSLVISVPLLTILVLLLTGENVLFNLILAFVSMFYLISVIVFLVGMETQMLFDVRRILMFTAMFVPYFLLVFLSIKLYIVMVVFAWFASVLFRIGLRRFD